MSVASQPDYDLLVGKLEAYISEPRIRRYLIRVSFKSERALKLYIWNAQVGEAFHPCIQASEVSLRNRVNAALIATFGNDWWKSAAFLSLIDREREKDLTLSCSRIRNLGKKVTTDQIVANLSFGFWVGMMSGSYNPKIWSAHIKTAFPNLPTGVKRSDVHRRAKEIADLRNRISHHEPIFERNLSNEHSNVMEFLRWMSPDKSLWIAASCRVQQMLRAKP
ncbi:Abi family protein [Ochrobactrum sp. Sa2BUA5]|nr:Abi family protein [Ochrobactrum gallinarum]